MVTMVAAGRCIPLGHKQQFSTILVMRRTQPHGKGILRPLKIAIEIADIHGYNGFHTLNQLYDLVGG